MAAGFSGDAEKVLVRANLTGTYQAYRVPRSGGELTQITRFAEPVFARYLPGGDQVLLHKDKGGNERHQISLINDDGSGLRDVLHDPDHIHRGGGITRDGKTLAYSCNRRNGVDFDVFVHDLASGDDRSVFAPGGWCNAAGFSPDGRYLAVTTLTDKSMDNHLYVVDLATDDVVHVSPHDDESQWSSPSWLPDGSSFLFTTDCGREFSSLARYDMARRSWQDVMDEDWDSTCTVDWEGRHVLLSSNEDGYTRLRVLDARSLSLVSEVPLPGTGVADDDSLATLPPQLSHDGRFVVYTFVSSGEPGDAWLFDTETSETTRLTTMDNPVAPDVFAEPELHRFSSFDGESIPVFLYRPSTPARRPPPIVVMVHGGPEGQYQPKFNPVLQYLVHRGYAVAAPNVRGSTGYGKRYHHLDDVRKRLDSVRDLEALHAWLGTQDLDAKRTALWGGSYGGYMVLAGLTFQPELWAAGIDIVGISSLVTFLENTAPWRRKAREREYGSLQNDREFLHDVSPLTHLDNLRAPLFIIHGANDPRVPLTEARQIHAALTTKGISTELLVYEDEGHGLAKLENRLDAYAKAVDFLDRVLMP